MQYDRQYRVIYCQPFGLRYRRHFLERNVFILCVVNILEVYHAVHESLVPTTWTREHLALALRYYMATLKTFYDRQVEN